eukprot:1367825-Amphidinium_carterae.1
MSTNALFLWEEVNILSSFLLSLRVQWLAQLERALGGWRDPFHLSSLRGANGMPASACSTSFRDSPCNAQSWTHAAAAPYT